MLRPRDLSIDNDAGVMTIIWGDGTQTLHSIAQLRKDCPCATCRSEREKLSKQKGPVIRIIKTDGPAVSQARIIDYSSVGRYAFTFTFNDGHGTGIYTYDFLRSLALEGQPENSLSSRT